MEDGAVLTGFSLVMVGMTLAPKTRIAVESQRFSGIPPHSGVREYSFSCSLFVMYVVVESDRLLLFCWCLKGERVKATVRC